MAAYALSLRKPLAALDIARLVRGIRQQLCSLPRSLTPGPQFRSPSTCLPLCVSRMQQDAKVQGREKSRNGVLEQSETFCNQFRANKRSICNIPAGPGEADNQFITDRIGHAAHDDRDDAGCLFGGASW
jgi:hypothetical protein